MARNKDGLKVMIAVDQSKYSDHALNFYLDHLHQSNNHVILIHNATLRSLAAMAGINNLAQANMQQEIWDDILKKADEQVKLVRAKYESVLAKKNVTKFNVYITNSDNTGEAIVKQAEDEGVQLIVMGTRGLGQMLRVILGSVSDYVLHHARVPVTICNLDD